MRTTIFILLPLNFILATCLEVKKDPRILLPKGWQRLVIRRTGDHPKVKHYFPPPSTEYIMFDAVFEEDFVNQVLKLYNGIRQLKVKDIHPFDDVCMKASTGECTIFSVMEYYQHDAATLNKASKDIFFTYHDYLDHFLYCTKFPYLNDNVRHDYNVSCLSAFGTPTFPFDVLQDFDGTNFNNATAFVATIPYNMTTENDITQWQYELKKWLGSYGNPNMTIVVEEPPNPVMNTRSLGGKGVYKVEQTSP